LCEGLLSQNGVAALKDVDFADGLVRIVSEYDRFKARARQASATLFHINTDKNPLFATLEKRRFDQAKRVLVVGQNLEDLPLADFEGSLVGLQVVAEGHQHFSDVPDVVGHFRWQPRLGEEQLGELPDIISTGLKAGVFSEIIMADECYDLQVLSQYFAQRNKGRPVRPVSEILGVDREVSGNRSGSLARALIPESARMTAGLSADIADPLMILIANRSLLGIQGGTDDPDVLEKLVQTVRSDEVFAADLLNLDALKLADTLSALDIRRQRQSVDLNIGSGSEASDIAFGQAAELTNDLVLEISAESPSEHGSYLSLMGRLLDPRKDMTGLEIQVGDGEWIRPLLSVDSGGFIGMMVFVPAKFFSSSNSIPIGIRHSPKKNERQPIGFVGLTGWIVRAPGSDNSTSHRDPLAPIREFQVEPAGHLPDSQVSFAASDRVAGVVEITGSNPSAHPLSDAHVMIDGAPQFAAVETNGESIILRVPIKRALKSPTQVEVELPNGASPSIERMRLLGRPMQADLPVNEAKMELGGQLRLLSFGFPRARFAQWRFALVDASFQGQHIEEIRFQLTVHDLIPFIAVA
ncbi:MAG: hypothetical protein AAGA69_10695, partial [Pseudomonadota bacterium]